MGIAVFAVLLFILSFLVCSGLRLFVEYERPIVDWE